MLAFGAEAIAQPHDLAFAGRERRHRALELERNLIAHRRVFGRFGRGIAHHVGQPRFLVVAEGRFERRRRARRLDEQLHLLELDEVTFSYELGACTKDVDLGWYFLPKGSLGANYINIRAWSTVCRGWSRTWNGR